MPCLTFSGQRGISALEPRESRPRPSREAPVTASTSSGLGRPVPIRPSGSTRFGLSSDSPHASTEPPVVRRIRENGCMGQTADRHVLIVAHTGREDSLEAAVAVCRQLQAAGLIPVLNADEYDDLLRYAPDLTPVAMLGDQVTIQDLEVVIVLGGDGTILRAAELTRGCAAPLLGVNLGHVGF